MTRLRVAALAVALLAATAPLPAHADGANYIGGCGLSSLLDPVGGPNPPPTVIYLAVMANDAGPVRVWCDLWVDGVNAGTVLGRVSGTGVVADARPFTVVATRADVVALCTGVMTSAGTEEICAGVPWTP